MNNIRTWRFITLYILIALAAVYVFVRAEVVVPVNQPLDDFPHRAGEWVLLGHQRFDERVLEELLPTDYISRAYRHANGDTVSIYIGYHSGGPESGPIHSPRQCLPGSGWNKLTAERHYVSVGDNEFPYVNAVYQKDLQRQLFLYWYQVRELMLTNEYALKFQMVKNAVTDNRRDAAFVRLAVMVDDEDYAAATRIGEQFMKDFLPAIHQTLPR